MWALVDKKPQVLKTRYLIAGFIKSTMGPRWKLNIEEIDPKSKKSIWGLV
jgi:ribosomal protein L1